MKKYELKAMKMIVQIEKGQVPSRTCMFATKGTLLKTLDIFNQFKIDVTVSGLEIIWTNPNWVDPDGSSNDEFDDFDKITKEIETAMENDRTEVQKHINNILKKASNYPDFCFQVLGVAVCSYLGWDDQERFVVDLVNRTLYKPHPQGSEK